MATLTVRPTSASGTSWQNTSRIYDGNNSQAATVSINGSNYSSRYLTVNFSTVDLPEYAQISSATLYIIAKQSSSTSSRRITVQVDINGSSSSRVINTQLTSTSNTTLNGDVSNYINNLTSLKITGQTTGSSYQSQTFSIYEVYVDIEYEIVEPEPDIPDGGTSETTIDIFLPQPLGTNDKLYWDDVVNRYYIQHSTGLIQTDITNKIEFNTCNSYMKITTDEKEVAPINITVELAMKEPESTSDGDWRDWIVVNTENGNYNGEDWIDSTSPDIVFPDIRILTTELINVVQGVGIDVRVVGDNVDYEFVGLLGVNCFDSYSEYQYGNALYATFNPEIKLYAYASAVFDDPEIEYISLTLCLLDATYTEQDISPNDVTVMIKYMFNE